jgi:hypothetical protein
MQKEDIIPVLRAIVEKLVIKDYDSVVSFAAKSRLSSIDIQEAIGDYPITLSLPPADAYENAIFIRIDKNTFHVDFDLWSEGVPSDLTLSCEFEKLRNNVQYCIEDLHVM